jgi:hypothetical protein
MATSNPPKDTIYIDVDDEITGIIDKLRSSDAKIVALVLPKRASVFQSIVNMKLLKRAADEDKKHLVLITSESGLLPLAGLAGVLVASTLTSKPAIPIAPSLTDDQEETVDEATGETEIDTKRDGAKPIGELAGLGAVVLAADEVETIEMDDEAEAPEALAAVADSKPKKTKKDQKLSVPNFERFRLLLILGVLALLVLITGLVVAFTVLPKATIAITTDASNFNANLNFTADTQVNAFDASKHILPAKSVSQSKTYTQQATASGQKNDGQKATGQVVLSNCSQDDITVPAGTGLSSGNLTFISQNTVIVPSGASVTKNHLTSCQPGQNTVNVSAQAGGSNYNLADKSKYIVSGRDSTTFSGTGNAMTGGTDNITKIVSQSDIDNAKSKITTTDPSVKQVLDTQLVQTGLFALITTYNAAEPTVTTSANAGDAADSVIVTETVTYSMLGVQQTDLKSLIDENVKKQIDSSKLSILDEGLRAATFTASATTANNSQLTLQTIAVAGPQLSIDSIKSMAAGKKSGDIIAQLRSNPDVTNVTIKLSPFFVGSVPKKTSRITVTIAKPKLAASSTSGSNNSSNVNATNP